MERLDSELTKQAKISLGDSLRMSRDSLLLDLAYYKQMGNNGKVPLSYLKHIQSFTLLIKIRRVQRLILRKLNENVVHK